MVKDIKFRAWDKKDKNMFYNVQLGICFDDGSHYDFKRFLGYQEPDDYHDWILMQYTGLKDKNGKEIYEGDIIKIASKMLFWKTKKPTGKISVKIGYVVYAESNARFSIVEKTGDTIEIGCLRQEIVSQYYEIIRNIYKNPELLKGE